MCAGQSSEFSVTLMAFVLELTLSRRRMVNAVAGPRARDLSQGAVGGMLGQLGYSQSEVVKL